MSTPPRVLVVAGSARNGSYNQKLATVALRLAEQAGAWVTPVDLRALDLPIYDADIEARGMPEGARRLRKLFAASDALLLATPEYNGFPTPLLVNALDWVTRPVAEDGLPSGMAALTGTVAGLLSASPGGLGGVRSLLFTRQFLQMNLGMLVVPEQFGLALADQAFDDAGALADPKSLASVDRVVQSVLRTTQALKQKQA
ncbi:MAG: NAD(P)H-dependent oxidoreductase [Burkholderiaceae bacterium]|nr:NAD(P)H-dependent oxidoreductase [Burkholderiaceae bacterium]